MQKNLRGSKPNTPVSADKTAVLQAGPAHAFPTQGHSDIGAEKSLKVSNKTPFLKLDRCFHFLLIGWRFVCRFALVLLISFGHQIELILIDTAVPHMRKQEKIVQNFNTFTFIAL